MEIWQSLRNCHIEIFQGSIHKSEQPEIFEELTQLRRVREAIVTLYIVYNTLMGVDIINFIRSSNILIIEALRYIKQEELNALLWLTPTTVADAIALWWHHK